MKDRGTPFKGFLFAGLMIDGQNPKVIEFNTRFGDPECQILMPLIEDDLLPIIYSAARGKMTELKIEKLKLNEEIAVHVVMTSRGYPSIDGSKMDLGEEITFPTGFLPTVTNSGSEKRTFLFFAGAKRDQRGLLVNNGGRVLGLTVLGKEACSARELAYSKLKEISFKGAHFRRDIGE
jgi:phosphoribosylamine---glycine ligase